MLLCSWLSHVRLFSTSRTAARWASLSFTISGACSNLVMPSNHLVLCHPPFFSLQFFPVSESFAMSQLFTSGGQSTGASASVLPMNIQDWFLLEMTSLIIKKIRNFQKNIYFCFIDYAKAFDCWITVNCGKFWKRGEYQTTWFASWEICMQIRKQQLELDMEQQTGSK